MVEARIQTELDVLILPELIGTGINFEVNESRVGSIIEIGYQALLQGGIVTLARRLTFLPCTVILNLTVQEGFLQNFSGLITTINEPTLERVFILLRLIERFAYELGKSHDKAFFQMVFTYHPCDNSTPQKVS